MRKRATSRAPARPGRLPPEAVAARSIVLVWVEGFNGTAFRAAFDREGLAKFEAAFQAHAEQRDGYPPLVTIHQFGGRERGQKLFAYPVATSRVITYCAVPPNTPAEREWMGVPEPPPPPQSAATASSGSPVAAQAPPARPPAPGPAAPTSTDPNDAPPPPPKADTTLQ